MLKDLRAGRLPADQPEQSAGDRRMDDVLAMQTDKLLLRRARDRLKIKSKNKKIDVVFRARISAMLGALNLFLDESVPCTWRQASVIVAKMQGQSERHARTIRHWLLDYLRDEKLPFHRHGQSHSNVLDDEDISTHLQLKLSERVKDGKYIVSADVCDIVASKDMQAIFKSAGICKPSISERTARRWLNRLSWRYKRKQNGMYIDGHERPDVVADRVAFCKRWADYEKRFVKFDNEGNELPRPQGFSVPGKPFRLILVTHDESTFYQNDQRRLHWQHTGTRAAPHPKGEGQSIMVSDFLTLEWGRLKDEKECVNDALPSTLTDTDEGRRAFSSRREKIATGGLTRKTCTSKLITRSTSSRASRTVLHRVCSCSTMPPVTRSEQQMRSQREKW